MNLYLVQHGKALPKAVDPQRNLNDAGRQQTGKMADFLQRQDVRIDHIWHSAKKRSFETARIFAEKCTGCVLVERTDINPLDPVEKLPEEIESSGTDLMIVGHLPFLSKLAGLLITGSEENEVIAIRNSGIVALEYNALWKIVWAVVPELHM